MLHKNLLVLIAAFPLIAAGADKFKVPAEIKESMNKYCFGCHDEDVQKGDIRLDNMEDLKFETGLDLMNRVQEQIFIEEMPPPKKKKQPTEQERKQIVGLIGEMLKKNNAAKLEEKLRRPEYANYVDHDKLFSGKFKDLKAYTPDRRWLISEFIFNDKINKLADYKPRKDVNGVRENVVGENNRKVNITNPFLLPAKFGIRYYANETLNGGHLLTMITNAKELSGYMMYQANRNSRYLPAASEIMKMETDHRKELESRRKFLTEHIDQVCQEIYGSEHQRLLPEFKRVEIPPAKKPVDAKNFKKAAFHAANPGKTEMKIIYISIKKLLKPGISDEKLIEVCEKEWFYAGHDPMKIRSRVVFLRGYMGDTKKQMNKGYNRNDKPPVYKKPSPEQFKIYSDAILKHRKKGDNYKQIIEKCMQDWKNGFTRERDIAGPPESKLVAKLVDELFFKVYERAPSTAESEKYTELTTDYIKNLGNESAIEKLIQTLILRSEFVYRYEFGQGEPDKYGRRMMSPRDASYALSYALTDCSPDKELQKAVAEGRLNSREDYRREVLRMLKKRDQYYIIEEGLLKHSCDSLTNMPIRELRFFREFFGYPNLMAIFKDRKRFGSDYERARPRLVEEADLLVQHILEEDKNVIEKLLTTDEYYVFHSGDNEKMTEYSKRIREIYDYFKDKGWEKFEKAEDLAPHVDFIDKVKMRGIDTKRLKKDRRYNPLRAFQTAMKSFAEQLGKGQKAAAPYNTFPAHGMANAMTVTGQRLQAPQVAMFHNIDMKNWHYETKQPFKVPNRKGMLTHPAWLIATAHNTETDPVKRGKFIREKLLAGTIPDVPITVDAVIPEDHTKTLRQRSDKKIGEEYCWKCHKRMNPIGYPFEMYDDFGRFRTKEALEHPDNLIKKNPDKGPITADLRNEYKALPVNPKGSLDGTGNPKLDGEVKDALDLIDRLGKSDKVRQSVIRYAFRYFMGRNEKLSDSKTLMDADQAYLKSGGSFDAVIVSLLTSDSFIYRKSVKE